MAPAQNTVGSQASGFRTPSFRPATWDPANTSPLTTTDEQWTPVLSVQCHLPLSVFLSTLKTLTLHPERNTSFILRADPLPSKSSSASSERPVDRPLGLDLVEDVRVRLMPRQPRRDGRLDQTTLFFRSSEDEHGRVVGEETRPRDGEDGGGRSGTGQEQGLVVMIPEVQRKEDIPYYHPPVRRIAFLYEVISPGKATTVEAQGQVLEEGSEQDSASEAVLGSISVHYLPFSSSEPASLDKAVSGGSLGSTPTTERLVTPASAMAASRPKRRSPLAGPSIEVDEKADDAEPTRPPATILEPSEELGELVTQPVVKDQPSGIIGKKPEPTAEERLYRTCLGMLERLYKHGYGQVVGYQKRRVHDVIVARENFQDLYLELKDRHRHLDSRAPKPGVLSTKLEDVKRHVWKCTSLPLVSTDDPSLPSTSAASLVDLSEWGEQDVAIAAFLMLLWRDMYPARTRQMNDDSREETIIVEDDQRRWHTWGRPPGGFVDLGCGNGLLVHILITEGYSGKGYELRARRTWPLYPPKTQEALVELSIEPPSWFPTTLEEWDSGSWPGKADCVVKDDTFLIGNHSDELTPWLPLLSLIPSKPVPYLSLPCCLHTLDSSFTSLQYTAPPHPHTPEGGFENGLEPGVSRYKSYLIWLGWTGLQCGWKWEKEGLRVPSTKGWGIIARNRWASSEEDGECREWALAQVNQVKARGAFAVREKEGKEH
ncbi:hypothetical protein IAU60_005090 [Kwoniella sp. DSM 27419]